MFDNVRLKIYNLPKNYFLCEKIENVYKNDINTYKGKIKNLCLWQNYNKLIIYGSLPKYLNGENINPLNRNGIETAIKKLEHDINLNLKSAVVCSVEFGASIIVKEKPFEYLKLFGNTQRLTKAEYSKWTGIETVLYTSPKGAFEFIGYDKIKEMLDKKQEIPALFAGSNVLSAIIYERLFCVITSTKPSKRSFAVLTSRGPRICAICLHPLSINSLVAS